jgi:predicted RNA-binding protein with TRAM domain
VPVKKNEEYIVDIIDMGFNGEGIAKIERNYSVYRPSYNWRKN